MPTVEVTIWIDAPLDRVYAIAKDSERYPDYMAEVQSVTVVEREGGRVVSDWLGIVPKFGLKIRWRQEEQWDDATTSSNFRQVKGDYDQLEGSWRFREERGGTRFDQSITYVYNVPTLGPLVKGVIHKIVVQNVESVAAAIKQRAERGA
ncbi:MAG: SRPBCC family protein [Fimbriimonadaceae bacterium]|nr:SRPBCC family protein [Fimbriimonadaceae bacterium]